MCREAGIELIFICGAAVGLWILVCQLWANYELVGGAKCTSSFLILVDLV